MTKSGTVRIAHDEHSRDISSNSVTHDRLYVHCFEYRLVRKPAAVVAGRLFDVAFVDPVKRHRGVIVKVGGVGLQEVQAAHLWQCWRLWQCRW